MSRFGRQRRKQKEGRALFYFLPPPRLIMSTSTAPSFDSASTILDSFEYERTLSEGKFYGCTARRVLIPTSSSCRLSHSGGLPLGYSDPCFI